MGRVPEALANVTLLRFRDQETLRSLLDLLTPAIPAHHFPADPAGADRLGGHDPGVGGGSAERHAP